MDKINQFNLEPTIQINNILELENKLIRALETKDLVILNELIL